MPKKRILSFILCLIMLGSCLPYNFVFADSGGKNERMVYLHAQGENPTNTPDMSTVYMNETTDLYFAVDNPNKGAYENGKHTEPQYDLNGYTVTIYFDPSYFDYAAQGSSPIDYTVPDRQAQTSPGDTESTGSGDVSDVPTETGYYPYRQGSSSAVINGKTYKTAYLTVFFSGSWLPQKNDTQKWYNLCKLPLTPKKTGSTQVFFDTTGEDGKSVELFAKNTSEELSDQTFDCTYINGGYHTINIRDKNRPSAPTADLPEGKYTEKQTVTLTAEKGCEIWYSTDGENYEKYTSPIEFDISTTIKCYAKRVTDGKTSNTVTFNYEIVPEPPYLFVEKSGAKQLITNIYSDYDEFTVYVSDKSVYGNIDDANEVYYTFSDISEDNFTEGTDPEKEWVKVTKTNPTIEITKKRVVRLITKKLSEYSDVSTYYLSIKPAKVTADKPSGEYGEKLDVMLSCPTTDAEIYYTLDGSDPIANGIKYLDPITLAKDTTLRAAAKFDGQYSDISSYYYIFKSFDDFGIDAFYPSGVYEGSVNVTLTANNPEKSIKYSTDNGTTWLDYKKTLVIDKDTIILAKAGSGGDWGNAYTFTYKIKPMPPVFAPESAQFTNASEITVFCVESTSETTDRFKLYYTLDGSDPITSGTRIQADADSDSAVIDIKKYTVISAVVLKDDSTYSSVVTHSYDIVMKKPSQPITTLTPGNYTRKIGDESGFSTQFMPVSEETKIYYTVSYNGDFVSDPVPNTTGTVQYDGTPIGVKGHTIIKAIAVNIFGIKSDVGIFEYTVTPEAPKAAPSATVSGNLPVVPITAVKGSTVKYEINGFKNEFVCDDGKFYLDTKTGNAYKDEACTEPLGNQNDNTLSAPAVLNISAHLDGVESLENRYTYNVSDADTLAAPYADKETAEYEEISVDADDNLLYIHLYSLNSGDTIEYKLNNAANWTDYDGNDGNSVKINNDTILQIRSKKDGKYSAVSSYVYNFVPLAPIITLPSGRYSKSNAVTTKIEYDSRAPKNRNYDIYYRPNGEKRDFRYNNIELEINHTMSFKAYVKNNTTGRVSKNAINYYIIESESTMGGSVYVASPYDVSRISADVLSTGDYAEGIKLLTQNKNASIHYFYSYTLKETGDSRATTDRAYDNIPISVNSAMSDITINAWLEDENGRIADSDMTHKIEFVHLNIPKTSLGSDKVEFSAGTAYTLINEYSNDKNILLYYTLDGSDPTDESNANRKLYGGETLTLNEAVTVKAVYLSVCGKCVWCKDDKPELCTDKVYGRTGEYKYTVPTVIHMGGGGGGGGRTSTDNTRKYTKDVFGNEHPTHIGYINGYPDGSVQPNGNITREEITSILYRIVNHDYEKPFAATGEVFDDVKTDRWSAHDIEYMSEKGIVLGYPDGEFKPENNLTRAEFAALISRFAKLEKTDAENPFPDLDKSHWAYDDILKLSASGLMQGYEDGTYRPEDMITRAEVMTVINKILGRNPSESYVKSLDLDPFTDLTKDKWYYTAVLEATVTHNYFLDNKNTEIKWEDCK